MQGRFAHLRGVLKAYHAASFGVIKALAERSNAVHELYDMVLDYPQRGGKGFRPAICIATCKAHGGKPETVMNTAAALELLHNAFLVHDDIEDASEIRRGKPTMHMAHGVPIAINVGDAMNVMSLRPLMDNLSLLGPHLSWKIFAEIEHMVRESVEGQAIELAWRKNECFNLQEQDYLEMVLKKTCWYTCIHPIRLGVLIATGSQRLDRFNRFGYFMGAAFQIQDDILNLVGDVEKYGKEIGGDILEGKRTLMLIHLLNNCTEEEHKHLKQLLNAPANGYDVSRIQWVLKRMQKYGSIDYARRSAKNLAGAALVEFHQHFGDLPASEDKEFLEDLVLYMIQRDY